MNISLSLLRASSLLSLLLALAAPVHAQLQSGHPSSWGDKGRAMAARLSNLPRHPGPDHKDPVRLDFAALEARIQWLATELRYTTEQAAVQELAHGLWDQLPRKQRSWNEYELDLDDQTLEWEVGMYLYQFVAMQMNVGTFAQTEAILQGFVRTEEGRIESNREGARNIGLLSRLTTPTPDANTRVTKAFARVAGLLLRDPAPLSTTAANVRNLGTDAAAPSAAAAPVDGDLSAPSLAGTSAGRMLGGPVAIPSSDDFKGVSVDQARVLHALGKARFWRMAIDPGTPPGLLKRQADAFFNSLFEAWSPQPSEAERTGFLQAFSRLLDSDPPQLQFWQMDRGAGEPYRATSLAMLKAMTTSAKDQLRAANESGSLKQAATDSGRAAAEAARQDADEAAREAAAAALEQ